MQMMLHNAYVIYNDSIAPEREDVLDFRIAAIEEFLRNPRV